MNKRLFKHDFEGNNMYLQAPLNLRSLQNPLQANESCPYLHLATPTPSKPLPQLSNSTWFILYRYKAPSQPPSIPSRTVPPRITPSTLSPSSPLQQLHVDYTLQKPSTIRSRSSTRGLPQYQHLHGFRPRKFCTLISEHDVRQASNLS